MIQTISGPAVPTAQICINKSRLKVYNKETDPTYYLEKGQEFQIELHNPTQNTILAKIKLNGQAISQGGLVLKPGQRVFLERYIDVARKFLFDTYEVNNTAENQKAIEKNGDFVVEFYNESIPNYIYTVNVPQTITIQPEYVFPTSVSVTPMRSTYTTSVNAQSPTGICNTSVGYNALLSTTTNSYNTAIGGSAFYSNAKSEPKKFKPATRGISKEQRNMLCKKTRSIGMSEVTTDALFSETIETGRVEAGAASSQQLTTVSKSFDYYPFHTLEYKMLPASQQVLTVADITVKQYCGNCGAKKGKTDKFCPSCGKKH